MRMDSKGPSCPADNHTRHIFQSVRQFEVASTFYRLTVEYGRGDGKIADADGIFGRRHLNLLKYVWRSLHADFELQAGLSADPESGDA